VEKLEYHKGSFCVYTSVFCQEGYCQSCEIYPQKHSPHKSIAQITVMRDVRQLHEAGRSVAHL
jgi:hypothetical protein